MLCKLFDLPLYRPETQHHQNTTTTINNSQLYTSTGDSGIGVGGDSHGGGSSSNGLGMEVGVTMKEDDTLSLVSYCLETLENILKKSLTIKVRPHLPLHPPYPPTTHTS